MMKPTKSENLSVVPCGTVKAQIFPVKQKSYYYSPNSALVPRTWTRTGLVQVLLCTVLFGWTRDVRQFIKTNHIFRYVIIASSVGKVVKAAVGGSFDSLLDSKRKLMRILDDSRNFIHLSHFRVGELNY